MRVLCVVHQPDAGPGVFADVLAAGGHDVDEWRPAVDAHPPAPRHDATLVLGGAMHVDQEAEHPWLAVEKELIAALVERGTPVLGLCLGAQLLAEAAGGGAQPAREPEIGWRDVELDRGATDDPLLGALPRRFIAFEWHSYEIDPPPGASTLARSDCCLQAFRAGERAWGVQFHAEVTGEIVRGWIDNDDGELAGAGVDPAQLAAESDRRIGESNRLGAAICGRFLALAR